MAISKVTLDTGADSGNYIGRSFVQKLPDVRLNKCQHDVRLGDGKTQVNIDTSVTLTLQMQRLDDRLTAPMLLHFYVVDKLGDEAIIGAPSLMSTCLDYFIEVLESITGRDSAKTDKLVADLQRLFLKSIQK